MIFAQTMRVAALGLALLCAAPDASQADDGDRGGEGAASVERLGPGDRPERFRCASRHRDRQAFLRSRGSIDFAHGLLWLAGGAGLSLGAEPSRRWSRENAFDEGIQDTLRIDSKNSRRDADSASDFFVTLPIAILPVAAIGAELWREGDCVEAWEMMGETFEAASLALFVSESIKLVTGRERPFGDRCRSGPPRDADCSGEDRDLSFPSGHATLAAAGAGVTCRFALVRESFGPSPLARIAPCALGAVGAFAAGTLRIASDRHWGTDVLVGFGVGALIGAFDPWGPLEWLTLEERDAQGRLTASGMLLPFSREGAVGARWTMVY